MAPIFSSNGTAIRAGLLRCFHFDSLNYEYTGWTDEYIDIGGSPPMLSTVLEPDIGKVGTVAVFSGDRWVTEEDHRGEVVYSIFDATATVVDYIGEIPDEYTAIAPVTRHDRWNGDAWVTDSTQQHAEDIEVATRFKRLLIEEAKSVMLPLHRAFELDIATDRDIQLLRQWKQYWGVLARIDVDAAPEISWPTKPHLR